MPESRHKRANRAMPSLRQTNAGNGHQDRTHKIHVGPADESAEAQPFRAIDGFCAKSLVFFLGVQRFRSIGVGWLVGWLVGGLVGRWAARIPRNQWEQLAQGQNIHRTYLEVVR